MKLFFLTFIVTILLIGNSFAKQKIVIHSWQYGVDINNIKEKEPELASKMDNATIVTNENEISHILSVMEEVSKAPAQLCGYDWVFLHFEDDKIIGRNNLNVLCRKEIIGDQLNSYFPNDSSNASMYTIKVDSRYKPNEIIEELRKSNLVIIDPNREFSRYPKIKIEYAIFKEFKKKRTPPIPRILFFFRSIADNIYFSKYLRANIRKLKNDFPEMISFSDGHAYNRGRISIILPIETDSTIMQKYSLPMEFESVFVKPETYDLFLVVDRSNIDYVDQISKFEGIKEIVKYLD